MPKRAKDLLGQRFGRLIVTARAPNREGQERSFWTALCDCGRITEAAGASFRGGLKKSCGCLRLPKPRVIRPRQPSATKHGHSAGYITTPTYNSWMSMRKRCLNPGSHAYPVYGGAGITICERWNDFANFLADMGERPDGKTLDRYPDHAGNYEPNNCRWATKREQAQNRKDNVFIEIDGERKCIADWERAYGIRPGTVANRIKYGWTHIQAITTPVRNIHV